MPPHIVPAKDVPPPPWWEYVAAGFVVFLLTQAFVGPVFAPTQEETPLLRLVWLPVYAVTLGLCLLRADRLLRAWPAILLLATVVLLAFGSRYWSIDPGVTQRRVIALSMTGAFAIYLGVAFRGVALPRLLTLVGLVLALGSLVFVVAMPSIGIHHDVNAGLWRGMWYEKNQTGQIMVCVAMAAAAWLATGDRAWRIPAATFVLAVFLMLMTQSKTSLLCLALGLGLIGLVWSARQGGAVLGVFAVWCAAFCAAVGGLVFAFQSELILEALGKDPSLTGRTDIWAALMVMVEERPWTGYGYSAFWGRDSAPADMIREQMDWPVPSAHHGWIDVLIQLGWPGAILVGLIFAIAILGSIRRLPDEGLAEGAFGLAYVCVVLLLSVSESVLLRHQDLAWALVLTVLARATMMRGYPAGAVASRPQGAYQTPSRIAAHSAHGQARRSPVPVRRPVAVRRPG